ncbi:DUF998 domain-containing protein [Enterococcus raffinosus]|uniref:DUF998 domain-containing protein n=1 Tax=Enterococcus raffinosus ATCC 49464 TaxID=1158602 RepID=R2PH60_9ENTE|nr:DUF998 domain-containing protein [Enterococcus raffinosus]EOH82533.1 hypothetical protein UAK_00770 [Enterococcus raffinosus ATCC 49464]EOT77629.1 hypothetical protein I590_01165 [Enterococcus raffinosus ATCC 49464]UXK06752.1 DUF998 domain-containing protein [Enterococcus raffinosus]
MNKKRVLIQWLGLLGVVGLLSYTAAVVFSPFAYPGYDWMAQAVSDLSAENSPSRILWNQLSSLSNISSVVSSTMMCVYIQGKLTKSLRVGIYLFTAMTWTTAVGYAMFPLTDSGYAGTFQDRMHVMVTVLVVLLSLVSLFVIIISGFRYGKYRSLAKWALLALFFMFAGAVGVNVVPIHYLGIAERFSVFAAMGFNAVLGIYLFRDFAD